MNVKHDKRQGFQFFDAHGNRLPVIQCPFCGNCLEAAIPTISEHACPNPGHYCVCLNCGEVLIFTETMGVRQVRDSELLDAEDREAIILTIKTSVAIKRRGRIL
jgi:hypothetical protein